MHGRFTPNSCRPDQGRRGSSGLAALPADRQTEYVAKRALKLPKCCRQAEMR
jgi:hypothetical protein